MITASPLYTVQQLCQIKIRLAFLNKLFFFFSSFNNTVSPHLKKMGKYSTLGLCWSRMHYVH